MSQTVTDTLNVELRSLLTWQRIDEKEIGSVASQQDDLRGYRLTDGAGPGQADLAYAADRTIPANSLEEIDLLDLEKTTLTIDVPYLFRQLRLIKVVNRSTEAGRRLLVGVDPGRPTTVYAADVGPGSEWFAINQTDAWQVVEANRLVYLANPSSEPVDYTLYLFGTATAPPEPEPE